MKTSSANPSSTQRRPEMEVLLCCARLQLEVAQAESLRRWLQTDLDWPYLLRLADHHGLQPLLYWNVNSLCPELVPPTLLKQLQLRFQINAGRNVALAKELLKVLGYLKAAGIPAIPYKGPVLAEAVYGNLALRQFSDLDILVRPEDASRAKATLIEQGYRSDLTLTPVQEAAYVEAYYVFDLVRQDGRVQLELHWALAQRYHAVAFDFEALWQRTEPVIVAGEPLPHFSPEDVLLTLCLHGTRHCWERLSWLADVADFLRQQDIDWDAVMTMARQSGHRYIMLLSLLFVAELLEAPVPAHIIAEAQGIRTVRRLVDQARQRLFQEEIEDYGDNYKLMFWFKARERIQDRAWIAIDRLLNPNVIDVAFIALPGYLSWLYYPIRLMRLIKKYSLSVRRGSTQRGSS